MMNTTCVAGKPATVREPRLTSDEVLLTSMLEELMREGGLSLDEIIQIESDLSVILLARQPREA